jgi:LmbE family N-acetylglucosaminyl deacetylase
MIIVVEPHADDAFISLGGHIEAWAAQGCEVTIVTVYAEDTRRAAEAERYAHAVGAKWVGLAYDEGEQVPPFSAWEVGDVLDRVIFPLGIQHPDHIRVRQLAPPGAEFYAEIPYYTKQKNQTEVDDKIRGRAIESILTPHGRKFRHIPIFQSQSKFFYFNPAESLKAPEIILR